jgi:hypothetical protein
MFVVKYDPSFYIYHGTNSDMVRFIPFHAISAPADRPDFRDIINTTNGVSAMIPNS